MICWVTQLYFVECRFTDFLVLLLVSGFYYFIDLPALNSLDAIYWFIVLYLVFSQLYFVDDLCCIYILFLLSHSFKMYIFVPGKLYRLVFEYMYNNQSVKMFLNGVSFGKQKQLSDIWVYYMISISFLIYSFAIWYIRSSFLIWISFKVIKMAHESEIWSQGL